VPDSAPVSQEIRLPTDVDGLEKAVKSVEELISRVQKLEAAGDRHHKKSEEHHKKSEEGWKGVGETIEGAKKKTHEFFEFIGAIAAYEVLEKIADKFIEIGREAVTTAAKAERLNFALEAAAGGAEGGERVLEWVEQNAKFSEFSDEQNAASYLQLKRFGVEDSKAGLYMKAAEDLAAVAAPDQREGVYQEALSAFQRMHARGKLDARSAMRLGFGVEDFAKLPQFEGKNKKQVAKALQTGSGNVTENDILNMVVSHTGEKALGERAADASQLLLTRMTKLSELPDQFYEKLGRTQAAKKLANEIGSILEKLDPDSPTGKRIFGALESAFDSVSGMLGDIDFDEVGDGIVSALKMVEPTLKTIESIATTTWNVFKGWVSALEAVSELIPGGEVNAKTVPKTKAEQSLDDKYEAQKAQLRAMKKGGTSAYDIHDAAAAMGKDVGDGFAGGIEGSTETKVERAAGDMADRAEKTPRRKLKIHSPSRVMEELGEMTGDGFARGLDMTGDRIDAAMDSTISVPAAPYVGNATGPAGRAGGVSLSIGEISIIVQGGQTNAETAVTVRDELARSLRPALADILDQADAEG
jgi:hypothetical protein